MIYKIAVTIKTFPRLIEAKDENDANERAIQDTLEGLYNECYDTIDPVILDVDNSYTPNRVDRDCER